MYFKSLDDVTQASQSSNVRLLHVSRKDKFNPAFNSKRPVRIQLKMTC